MSRLKIGGTGSLLRKRVEQLSTCYPGAIDLRICGFLPPHPSDSTNHLIRELECAGVPTAHLGHTGPFGAIRTLRRILQHTRSADLIHGLNAPLSYVTLGSRLARKPLVIEWVGTGSKPSGRGGRAMKYLASLSAHANVAVSYAVRQTLPSSRNVRVIYPPLSPGVNSLTPSPEVYEMIRGRSPIVLMVSRLAALKGIQHIPDVVRAVVSRFPSALFLIAGDGPERGSLERALRAHGIGGSVALLGFRTDVASLHEVADIYVSTSESEGLVGYATLEAIVAGTPVVASAIPAVSEILRDDIDAFLASVDDPEAYAGAVERLVEDESVRDKMVRNAQARIGEMLAPGLSMRQLVSLYQEYAVNAM